MLTKLARISELSAENPNMVFVSVAHLINVEVLTDCHRCMDGRKAVGTDGVTKDEYGKNLKEKSAGYKKPEVSCSFAKPSDVRREYPLLYLNPDADTQDAYRRVVLRGEEPVNKTLSHYMGSAYDCMETI